MAVEIPGFELPFEAAEDLSAKQYYFVKLDGDGKIVAPTAVTDQVIGVLQNDPDTGEMGSVMIFGVSKVVADAAITLGDIIGTSLDGQAQTAVATQYSCGKALETVTGVGQIFKALIGPGFIVKA